MIKKTVSIFIAFVILVIPALMTSCSATDNISEEAVASEKGHFLPIIMYHSVIGDERYCNDYVISENELREDFSYLSENGYTAVSLSQVRDYVYLGRPLPHKPVVLTFDDGNYNFLTVVMPLLKEYGFCATLSVVGSFSQKETELMQKQSSVYSYLTFEQIKQISKCGYVEIASHSYNMHSLEKRRGALKMENESYEEYRSRFISDILVNNQLLLENCGVTPSVYTYPYGFICEESLELVKGCRFSVSLGVAEKPNYITSEKDCLYCLGRYNRPHGVSTEDFFERVLSGK